MSHPRVVLATSAIAMLWTGPAIAEPRSGFSLHVLTGPGYATGEYVVQGNSVPMVGFPVRPLTLQTTVAAPMVSASLQPGWFVTQHLKVALELGVFGLFGGSRSSIGQSHVSGVVGWQALALVDYHVSEGPGFHMQGGGGFARAQPMGDKADIGSPDNIADLDSMGGATGFVGIGYDFCDWFGLLARGSTARLSNGDSRFHPVALGLIADFALY